MAPETNSSSNRAQDNNPPSRGTGILSPSFLICMTVGLLGCLAVYNATFYTSQPFYYVSRQTIWLCIGIAILYVSIRIPLRFFYRWTLPCSSLILLLMYLGEFLRLGSNDLSQWLNVNLDAVGVDELCIEAGHLGYPFFVFWLVKLSTSKFERDYIHWKSYLQYLFFAVLWFIPLALRSEWGTLIPYLVCFALIYWLQSGRVVHLAVTVLVALTLAMVCLKFNPDTTASFVPISFRMHHNTDTRWETLQLQNTLASGGLWGREMGNAMWSRNYLPEAQSDSIFATLAESIGYVGILPIVLGVVAWAIYSVSIAKKQENLCDALIVFGLTTMISTQAFLHISVATGFLPPIGVSLPLLSYGGSSLLAAMFSIGVVLGCNADEHNR